MAGGLRLLLMTIALWLIISSLRRLFLLLFSRRDKEGKQEQKELPLVQDPQCGRFMLERDAVYTSLPGQGIHFFCSQECRDLYHRSHIIDESD